MSETEYIVEYKWHDEWVPLTGYSKIPLTYSTVRAARAVAKTDLHQWNTRIVKVTHKVVEEYSKQ